MLAFSPGVRITNIGNESEKDVCTVIRLCFDTGNTLVSSKSVFDLIHMLNGHFTAEHIIGDSVWSAGSDSKKVLDELLSWKILRELPENSNSRYTQAKGRLSDYVAHFPRISNVNVMMAVLLRKLRVRAVFYEDKAITQDDYLFRSVRCWKEPRCISAGRKTN